MNWFKGVYFINTMMLISAVVFMAAGIGQVFQFFSGFNDLTKHQGVVASKFLYTEKAGRKDSINVIKLLMENGQEYIVSRYSKKLDNLIMVGDTTEFYTKPVNSLFGNFITNGNGRVWNTRNENELFHLLSNRYESPILDFKENRQELLKTAWIFPIGSLLVLGLYIYRRSGRKSPLVMESGGWTSS
jgi:hypothetical protein